MMMMMIVVACQVYCGGHARMVETLFKFEKDELLYVGDHICKPLSYYYYYYY
jgi:hypothetical protein